MKKIWLLFLCFSFISSSFLIAQTESFAQYDDVNELMEEEELALIYGADVITTASKREQSILDSPSAISILTADDIKNSGAIQLTEALNLLPGVHFGYSIGHEMLTGGIRGFDKLPTNKIVLLIDGALIDFPAYGIPSFGMMPVDLNEIERVEVLRGAGSSLYGANAMFGVINIITKNPKDIDKDQVSITAGEQGTLMASYLNAGTIKENSLYYRLSLSWKQMDGYDDVAFATDPLMKYGHISSKVDYYIDDNNMLSFWGAYIDNSKYYITLTSIGPLDVRQGDSFSGTVTYEIQDPSVTVRYTRNSTDFWDSGSTAGNRTYYLRMFSNTIDVQNTLEPGDSDVLTWGLSYRNVACYGDIIGGKRQHDLMGYFLDNTYGFNDEWALNTGARVDSHPNTDDNLSHRLSLLYTPYVEHGFRATWATSFRNPDFIESYYYSTLGPVVFKGYETNKVEKAEMLELGYRGLYFDKLEVNSNLFYINVEDLVDFVRTSVLTFDFINLNEIDQYGTELEVKYPFTDWLTWSANYTYYDLATADVNAAKFIDQTPQYMVKTALLAKLNNGWYGNLMVQSYDETRYHNTYTFNDTTRGIVTRFGGDSDTYVVVNLRVGREFELWENETELTINVLNLLDQDFDDYPISTSSIGRRITGNFIYRF
ncbi:MAG: TonB-dependent receptor [Candidatus Omnitrophota bacterium]